MVGARHVQMGVQFRSMSMAVACEGGKRKEREILLMGMVSATRVQKESKQITVIVGCGHWYLG